MALRCQVVDFIRPNHADDLDEGRGVAQITIMQMELRVSFKMRNPLTVVDRTPSDDAMNVVSLSISSSDK